MKITDTTELKLFRAEPLKNARRIFGGESNRAEKIFLRGITAMAVCLVLLFLLQLANTDYSLNQREHRPKVGIIFEDLSNPVWQATENEWRKAEAASGLSLVMRDGSHLDDERRRSVAKELFSQKSQLLVIALTDVRNMGRWEEILRRDADDLAQRAEIVYLTEDDEASETKQFALDAIAVMQQIIADKRPATVTNKNFAPDRRE